MTTAYSPLRILKTQADQIATMVKAAERGEPIADPKFAAKIAAARAADVFKIGVVMDDKIITIEMPWPLIRETSEAGISEFILREMREARDPAH